MIMIKKTPATTMTVKVLSLTELKLHLFSISVD